MKDGEKPAWIEQDMTGKPIEEVIEYEVGRLRSRSSLMCLTH